MSVTDRWHTNKPRAFTDDGEPVTCEHRKDDRPLYPSADHGCTKRWQVRWRDLDGKQCKRNFAKKTGRNPNEHADAFDKMIQGELAKGTYTDPTAGEISLQEYALIWRAGLTGKPSKLRNADKKLAHIIDIEPRNAKAKKRYPGKSPIARRSMRELALRPQLIQSWVVTLQDRGVGTQYIRHILEELSTIFQTAVDNSIVYRNPVQSSTVKPPPLRPPLVQPWEPKLVAAVAKHIGSALPFLGASAGLRIGEMLGFTPADIDRDQGVVWVRRQVLWVEGHLVFSLPKRDKIRSVPLSEFLDAKLRRQIERTPPTKVTLPWLEPGGPAVTHELLFVRPDGKAYHPSLFNRRWNAARQAAGVDPTPANGTHVLRHTYASACLAEGADIRALAEWLGHDDAGFTLRRYMHLMPSAAARGRAAIDKFFEGLDDDD